MVLIGLAGPDGSGKSSVAKALAAKHGGKVLSFATPMKKMLRGLLTQFYLDTDVERMLYGDLKNQELGIMGGKTPREMMQTLASGWGRKIVGPDIWVNMAVDELSYWNEAPLVIFDDVRMLNEAEMIAHSNGFMFEIIRTGFKYNPDHESSAGLGIGMPTITNDNPDEAADLIMKWIKRNV